MDTRAKSHFIKSLVLVFILELLASCKQDPPGFSKKSSFDSTKTLTVEETVRAAKDQADQLAKTPLLAADWLSAMVSLYQEGALKAQQGSRHQRFADYAIKAANYASRVIEGHENIEAVISNAARFTTQCRHALALTSRYGGLLHVAQREKQMVVCSM